MMATSNTNTLSTKCVLSSESGPLYLLTPIQPTFPDLSWEPLKEVKVIDRALHATSEKKNLLSAASKVITLTPTIGTELQGIYLGQLSDTQKDELWVPFLSFPHHQAILS
jgi:sulfonate dioxygenase